MLCKAVNRWRGVEFAPEIDPNKPFDAMNACLGRFASELHTGQVEIVIDREFNDILDAHTIDAADYMGKGPRKSYIGVPVVIIGE